MYSAGGRHITVLHEVWFEEHFLLGGNATPNRIQHLSRVPASCRGKYTCRNYFDFLSLICDLLHTELWLLIPGSCGQVSSANTVASYVEVAVSLKLEFLLHGNQRGVCYSPVGAR